MKVIVIIESGIVSGVRSDSREPTEVEILDIDKDYEDYERLRDYKDSVYKDESLEDIEYVTVRFDSE